MTPEPRDADDESLARRARAGDPPSFEALVVRHHPRLVRYAAQRLRDVHAAEDVAQAAFVSAWRALHQWDPDRPFLPWLFAICRSRLIDHVRRAPPPGVAAAAEPAHNATPDRDCSAGEDARGLWTWMRAHLSERQHAALWLHYQENFSVAEAAAAMRLTVTHVKVLLHRARHTLARELAGHPEWRDCLVALATRSTTFSVPIPEGRTSP